MTFARTPATIVYGFTSLVTTLPAATTEPSAMFTPGNIVTLQPIHTSFPIVTFEFFTLLSNVRSLFSPKLLVPVRALSYRETIFFRNISRALFVLPVYLIT